MIHQIRQQHPEESAEQHLARLKYREKHLNKRQWNVKKYLPWLGWVLFVFLAGSVAKCQTTNVDITRQNGTLVDGTGLPVKCLSGCGGAATDTTASGALGSLNATLQIAMAGVSSAAVTLPSGNNLVGTLIAESSSDGGTTWAATVIRSSASTGLWGASVAVSSTNASYNIQVPGGASHVRVRINPYTSGTATASIRATTQPDSQPDPLVQGTQAAGSATQPNPQVFGGWDGSNVRSLKTLTDGTLLMSLPQQPFLNVTDFTDVTAGNPVNGDIIEVQSGKWARLATGGANTVFHGGGAYSAVVQGDVTSGYVDLASTQATIAGLKTFTTGITTKVENVTTNFCDQFASAGIGTTGSPWTGWETCITGLSTGGKAYFPAGFYETNQLNETTSNVVIEGAGLGSTTVRMPLSFNTLVDAMDATTGWAGTDLTVATFTTLVQGHTANTQNPYPAKSGVALMATGGVNATHTLSKTVSLNMSAFTKIGFWYAIDGNAGAAFFFRLGDGANSSCWLVTPSIVYMQWAFAQLTLLSPTNTANDCSGAAGGTKVNLAAVTSINLGNSVSTGTLVASQRYYFDQIINWNASADINFFTINASNVTIKGLNIQHVDANGGSTVYVAANANGFRMYDNRVTGGFSGIYTETTASDAIIEHNQIANTAVHGIQVTGPRTRVAFNTVGAIPGLTPSTIPSDGIVVNTATALKGEVSSNDVENVSGSGIHVDVSDQQAVTSNAVRGVGLFGIYVNSTTNSTIASNVILTANECGICLQGDSGGTTVTGNSILNTGKNAIDTASRGITISGNTIDTTGFSNGWPNSEAKCVNVAIGTGSGQVEVVGNSCRNPGQATSGSGNAFGIGTFTGQNNVVIVGNGIYNPANHAIWVGSANSGAIVESNHIDLNSVAGAQGIICDAVTFCNITNNIIVNPNSSLGAVGVISTQNASNGGSISGNILNLASAANLVGIKIASGVNNIVIGSANQTFNVGAGGAGISDAGTGTKFNTSNTFASAETQSATSFIGANVSTSAGSFDLSLSPALTGLKIPVAAGAAPTVNGAMAYDSTANKLVVGVNGATFKTAFIVASGTSAMTTAAISTGACGSTVTTTATGALTTDRVDFTRNAAATNGNGGNLILNSWVTSGNINWNYCNPSAGTVTPTAMTMNWAVMR